MILNQVVICLEAMSSMHRISIPANLVLSHPDREGLGGSILGSGISTDEWGQNQLVHQWVLWPLLPLVEFSFLGNILGWPMTLVSHGCHVTCKASTTMPRIPSGMFASSLAMRTNSPPWLVWISAAWGSQEHRMFCASWFRKTLPTFCPLGLRRCLVMKLAKFWCQSSVLDSPKWEIFRQHGNIFFTKM